jgi:hypothetical protein
MSGIERSKPFKEKFRPDPEEPFMKQKPEQKRPLTVKISPALKKRMQHFIVDMQSTGIDQDELVTKAIEEYLSKRGR